MQIKVTIICDHLAHRPRGAHSYRNTDPGNAAQTSISLWQKHQWNLASACAAGPLGHVLLGDPFPPPATIPAKRSSVSSICLFTEWFKCDTEFQECLFVFFFLVFIYYIFVSYIYIHMLQLQSPRVLDTIKILPLNLQNIPLSLHTFWIHWTQKPKPGTWKPSITFSCPFIPKTQLEPSLQQSWAHGNGDNLHRNHESLTQTQAQNG